MRKKEKTIFFRRMSQSFLVIILLAVVLGYVFYKCIIQFQKYLYIRKEYEFSVSERKESQNKFDLNQNKLDNINTDEGQEKYIKETYPVKKIGENMIVLYNSPDSTYDIPKAKTKWQLFKDYLKKLFNFD